MGTPIYSWSVRSTGDNLALVSEVGGGQSCGAEPLLVRSDAISR